MAHEIESMFYVGKEPWHGLGIKIPESKRLSIEEGIVAAGLDWRVELRRLYAESPSGPVGLVGTYASCRTSDNSILGVVGPGYTPLQNKDAFSWFQPFLDTGMATLETAGSLKNGQKVWILAKVHDSQASINGDQVDHYVLLSNSHDGNTSARVGFTPIRVVCNNTLCLAHESEASKLIRVRHTSHIRENLESIREVMDLARKEFYATAEQYRALAKKQMNKSDLERYVKIVFGLPENGGKDLIPKIIYLFEHGRGSEVAGKSYWGAYNAVTEYLNYFRGRTQDNTLDSLWHGDSAQVNARALRVAMLQMAA